VFSKSTNLASASQFIPDQNAFPERVIREAQVATSFPFGVIDKSILNTANSNYTQRHIYMIKMLIRDNYCKLSSSGTLKYLELQLDANYQKHSLLVI